MTITVPRWEPVSVTAFCNDCSTACCNRPSMVSQRSCPFSEGRKVLNGSGTGAGVLDNTWSLEPPNIAQPAIIRGFNTAQPLAGGICETEKMGRTWIQVGMCVPASGRTRPRAEFRCCGQLRRTDPALFHFSEGQRSRGLTTVPAKSPGKSAAGRQSSSAQTQDSKDRCENRRG